ncbi:hypothetical protein DSECCO2_657720 [anaerobic digester metagenome]
MEVQQFAREVACVGQGVEVAGRHVTGGGNQHLDGVGHGARQQPRHDHQRHGDARAHHQDVVHHAGGLGVHLGLVDDGHQLPALIARMHGDQLVHAVHGRLEGAALHLHDLGKGGGAGVIGLLETELLVLGVGQDDRGVLDQHDVAGLADAQAGGDLGQGGQVDVHAHDADDLARAGAHLAHDAGHRVAGGGHVGLADQRVAGRGQSLLVPRALAGVVSCGHARAVDVAEKAAVLVADENFVVPVVGFAQQAEQLGEGLFRRGEVAVVQLEVLLGVGVRGHLPLALHHAGQRGKVRDVALGRFEKRGDEVVHPFQLGTGRIFEILKRGPSDFDGHHGGNTADGDDDGQQEGDDQFGANGQRQGVPNGDWMFTVGPPLTLPSRDADCEECVSASAPGWLPSCFRVSRGLHAHIHGYWQEVCCCAYYKICRWYVNGKELRSCV